MGSDDPELIARWQRGDVAAFEALVRRWQQPVARFISRLVGRTEIVSDLCQEVFLRVYQAGPRYRESGAFSTWLYRIALNVVRDSGRRHRAKPVPLVDHEVMDRAAPADRVCQQRELGRLVARAVAELPEPLRLALVLRHYEEMSFEEMARLLGTPPSTLKSRFATALNRMRDRLQELGLGPEEGER
jgi:RNA polymerase sigma-70 factor (ECF subfamily)